MKRLKIRSLVWLIPIILLISTACLFGARRPTITNHPMPEFPSSADNFDETSCPVTNGVHICQPQGALGQLGCSQIRQPGDVLSGLRPTYPLRVCLAGTPGGAELPKGEYLYREGCLAAYFIRYVIQKDGKFELIKSAADLQKAYAPIENDLEALSYALAASGLGVRYDLQYEPDLRYFVSNLEDTFVKRNDPGYIVHLYDFQTCGCGPHPTTAIDLQITFDGQIQELQRVKVFEDPAEDKLCVD